MCFLTFAECMCIFQAVAANTAVHGGASDWDNQHDMEGHIKQTHDSE